MNYLLNHQEHRNSRPRASWGIAFDQKGWVGVPGVMTGLKRAGCNELYCLEMVESANLAQGDCKATTVSVLQVDHDG